MFVCVLVYVYVCVCVCACLCVHVCAKHVCFTVHVVVYSLCVHFVLFQYLCVCGCFGIIALVVLVVGYIGITLSICPSTAMVALWLRHPPREREVLGSIPGRVIPKTLKWAFYSGCPAWRLALWG